MVNGSKHLIQVENFVVWSKVLYIYGQHALMEQNPISLVTLNHFRSLASFLIFLCYLNFLGVLLFMMYTEREFLNSCIPVFSNHIHHYIVDFDQNYVLFIDLSLWNFQIL